MDSSVHPSFSVLYEGPFAERIPFNEGPDVALNGEISTFLSLPIKRNDHRLPSKVPFTRQILQPYGTQYSPSSSSTFLSILRSRSTKKDTSPGGPLGGLKPSDLNYVDFKRALLPSILAAIHPRNAEADNNTGAPKTRRERKRAERRARDGVDLHTFPGAQSDLLLTEAEGVSPDLIDGSAARKVSMSSPRVAGGLVTASSYDDEGEEEEDEEEQESRSQLLKTTALLLPTETQWYLLNELRIHAGAPELSEQGVERLSHYYAQLLYLEPKFPFETDEIQINFTWFEAFNPDRKVMTNCIQYEKGSVLFNIAAVYSRLATRHSSWSVDGKRRPAAYFQKSAGVLLHIRDCLCSRFKPRLYASSDLHETTLTAAAEMMLAQGMECYYDKAEEDKTSSPVIAMIAAQTGDYYEVAWRAATAVVPYGKPRFKKSWPHLLKSKSHLFTAIAHFHTPPHLTAESAVSERIARVALAKELAHKAVKAAHEVGGALMELVQGHATTITTAHLFLEHANFEKHHHPSFDTRLLAPLKRPMESLVHPSPIDTCVTDPRSYRDLFHAILSPTHHNGVRQFLEECRRIVEVGRAELRGCIGEIDG
ncbi:Rhophilin, Rho GTPase binding protein, partial [Borealophlyctis nickersoniae]